MDVRPSILALSSTHADSSCQVVSETGRPDDGTDPKGPSSLQMLIDIPPGFGRDLSAGRHPEVGLFIDGSSPFEGAFAAVR